MKDLIDEILNKQVIISEVEKNDFYILDFFDKDETCNNIIDFSADFADSRYPRECIKLMLLAYHQLNSEKNKVKLPIEDMSYDEIFEKIDEEYNETRQEFYQNELSMGKIDKRRALLEIGDLAAMLAGLLAKVLKEK